MRRALVLVAVLALLGPLGACVRPPVPTRVVVLTAGSYPATTSVIAVIDIIGMPGSGSLFQGYPKEIVSLAPIVHTVIAEVRSIEGMSITVHPVEPGQTVTCTVQIDMKVLDTHEAEYPAAARCIGPPV